MIPINLKDIAKDTYRLDHDESAEHEPGGSKDPWLYIIPCRSGHIYPHSDTHLALWWESTDRLDKIWPPLTLYQDGTFEKTYLFKAEDFEVVAKKAGAKRERHLSATHKKALLDSNKQSRFGARS